MNEISLCMFHTRNFNVRSCIFINELLKICFLNPIISRTIIYSNKHLFFKRRIAFFIIIQKKTQNLKFTIVHFVVMVILYIA